MQGGSVPKSPAASPSAAEFPALDTIIPASAAVSGCGARWRRQIRYARVTRPPIADRHGEFPGPAGHFRRQLAFQLRTWSIFRIVSPPPAWHSACPFVSRTMLRSTTLLIVLVLAGGSTRSLACELWCTTAAAGTHQRAVGCHDASQAAPKGPRIARNTDCHDAVATTLFVTEARQTESRSSACSAAWPAVVPFGSMVAGDHAIAAGYCVFSVSPPRPPSSRSVLRV